MFNREDFEFRYFFNAGLDKITCQCDAEGSDVYYKGHYIGSIYWVCPSDISQMEDDEVEELFKENGILY